MAVSISMNIIQNSQSIENNTSNVTVAVYAHWTNGSYNAQTAPDGYPDARGTLSIDGTSYAFYSKFNTGHTTSGSQQIFSKTLDISHNNEGEKVLSCWASYATGVSSGTVSTTGSKALTTIPRKSVLTVSNGTLGTAQTLTVTRKSTLLTHTVQYSCGNTSGTICTKSSTTSLSWTPPISLAAQYPNSTSVSVTFTITTYNGDTNIGASTVTISCAIPASVKPSVSLAVSDPTGYLSKYSAYVQSKSKIRIVATASGNQGSSITAYKTEADGKTYTGADVTTDVIKGTGTLTIKVTVTDSRGRTATASTTISVLAYSSPNVSSLSVSRCDASGNASSSGAYLAVRFNAAITALNNKNSATYTVQYKKSSATSYTTQTLSSYAGKYSVSNGSFIFAAETAYSYDVILTAKDDFTSTQKSGVGSSIKKTWSMLKNGLGFAFGKIAEKANTLDMGWNIELNGNEVLKNGSVAYAPSMFGYGENLVSIGSTSDDTAFVAALTEQFNSISAKTKQIMFYHGGGAFVGTLWNAGNNYGLLIANSYAEPNVGYRFKQMVRVCKNGTWDAWVDNSPTAFAPAGYGLGGYIQALNSNNDLNTTTGSGLFGWGSSAPANAPFNYAVMLQLHRANGSVFQKVWQVGVSTDKQCSCERVVNDNQGEWEWVNPPMANGTEYRTTERANGKPVYVKRVTYTPNAALGSDSTVTSISIPHGINGFGSIVRCYGKTHTNYLLPYTASAGGTCTINGADATNITMRLNKMSWSNGYTFYFDLYYTK